MHILIAILMYVSAPMNT